MARLRLGKKFTKEWEFPTTGKTIPPRCWNTVFHRKKRGENSREKKKRGGEGVPGKEGTLTVLEKGGSDEVFSQSR